jgi:glycyl-tRNA synthetase alpha chain
MPDGAFAAFHREQFERLDGFAWTLLRSGLVLPALDYCLKCSHVFNVLDASGSIGVTERTAYILKVRKLAVALAKAWLDQGAPQGDSHGS